MAEQHYNFDKIAKPLVGIKDRLDKNRGVKAELIYKAADLDKVLFAGDVYNDVPVKYGGFEALEKEEKERLKKERLQQNLWIVGGWIFAVFTPIIYKCVEPLLDSIHFFTNP